MASVFENISTLEQKKLLKSLEATYRNYSKGDIIPTFINNDILGIIISGYIEITKEDYKGNRTIVDELEENKIIGNSFYINLNELTIRAKENTTILYIDYDRIINFTNIYNKTYTEFLKNLLLLTQRILTTRNEKIEILSKRSIRDKLLEYLHTMSKKYGSKIIYLPFSYTDLADYLSVDRSALSRELNNLKNEGFIETKGRKIILLSY